MVCHDGVPVPFEPFSICYLVADYTVVRAPTPATHSCNGDA